MSSQSEEENVLTFGIHGFPEKCICGREATIYMSKTQSNPGRPFFRCPMKKKGHLFNWVEGGVYEEVVNIIPRVGGIESILSEFHKAKYEFVEFKDVTEELKEEVRAVTEVLKEELMETKLEMQRTKLLLKFCFGFSVS